MKTIRQSTRILVFSLAAAIILMAAAKQSDSWSAQPRAFADDNPQIRIQTKGAAIPMTPASHAVSEVPRSLFASPSAHWGTFRIGAAPHCGGLTFCGQVAFSAFADAGFGGTVKKNNDYSISGRNEDSVVVVVCTPISDAELSATIFSASSNNDSAAKWRSEIRAKMLSRKRL